MVDEVIPLQVAGNAENPQGAAQSPVGAALVVGAGVAGMQAALDLAATGIKVYLADRQPAIGGTMAMLDKTFPTNDCAMCILSPKLVEVSRSWDIELLNGCEVVGIAGEAGNFTVTLNRQPRYVDLKKCTGCGDCAEVCPVRLPDAFNGGLSERKAIYKLYPQAIPSAYAIEKRGRSPCRDACPIHQRAQGYLALAAAGRFADAYRTILEDNPFPSICGRVCNHRCEQACSRAQVDAAVNIMAVKRFIADWAWEHQLVGAGDAIGQLDESLAGRRVAIVGAGPAGLTCARELARRGCQATVYEALPAPGGMMRVGVPTHRLPPQVVQREIDALLAQAAKIGHPIELVLNHRIDDVEALLRGENGDRPFDAVFVAIGAHQSARLPIPGNDLPQVLLATEFLRNVNLALTTPDTAQPVGGQAPILAQYQSLLTGKRVLVLGGGNVAIDAAMTALRLGAAWVGMTCLEGRHQMPAHPWEIAEAEEEGIEIFPGRTFIEITQQAGRVTGVRTRQVNFRGFIDGRPDFDEFPQSEAVIPAEAVIFAVGQRPESGCLKTAQKLGGNRIAVDAETLTTSVAGIFAGGDAVTGAGAIVDAIAAGRRAALSIAAYLLNQERSPDEPSPQVARLSLEAAQQEIAAGIASPASRLEVPKLAAQERQRSFAEMTFAFSEEQARAEAARCLRCGVCSECNQCVDACRAGAIQHDELAQQIQVNVGAVILTPGLEAMPGNVRPEYGYGRYPNVVTSVQFERMLSASGPFGGVLRRPSDGAHPRRIAWIQCVGSREATAEANGDGAKVRRASYCSSVCCTYAAKEAMIAREHDSSVEATIFYIDNRSFGKGFDAYIERGKKEGGIRYIRCMISSVKEAPQSHNLRLAYVSWEGEDCPADASHDSAKRLTVREEEFDLVVLSVGLTPSREGRELAQALGIRRNAFGFALTSRAGAEGEALEAVSHPDLPGFAPTQTSRPGIFAAGTFTEPKDIPDSVIEASCAAAEAAALLSRARHTLTRQPSYPPERDVRDEPPRVGVFVCHCGINIGAVVDTAAVVAHAQGLPDVVYAERNLYTCSQDTQERMLQRIQEHRLNRVVVASCTPRTHEPLFQDTLRQAGLNPHLFEMANIREQDSWVHRAAPQSATEKAKDLVAMAVAKARKLRPIQRSSFEVDRRALVIGGGLAGMTAALTLARMGFASYLVEREAELGGNLRHVRLSAQATADGRPTADPQQLLETLRARVMAEPLITVLTESQVTAFGGYPGQYRTKVQVGNRQPECYELAHGVVIVATGGREMSPQEYLYGEHPRVITQRQLEAQLESFEGFSGEVVMIQCVGSRDAAHPYCSRICCTQALKNALALKQRAPAARVIVLYRDVRSYGFREWLYQQARRAGVLFLEYSEAHKPRVSPLDAQRLAVTVAIQPDGEALSLRPDWLVLSVGIEPEPGNAALAQLLKTPLTAEGFFLEAHAKLRPVDFAAEGIFLAGLAHSPRDIGETIAQAQAAAVRAAGILSKTALESTPIVASVNPRLCAACGICVEVCPYGARRLEQGMPYAEVIEVLCQGCGACAAACPNKATQQKGFHFEQVFDMLEAIP